MRNLATSLFFFAAITAVSALAPPGLYNIVSRVLSGTGQELAITFNGINTPVTLQPLNSTSINQTFSLTNFDSISMSVFPAASAPGQEIGPTGSPSIIASVPFDTFVFTISGNSSGFIIGGASATTPDTLWFPTTVDVGSQINFASNFVMNDLRAFWILIPIIN